MEVLEESEDMIVEILIRLPIKKLTQLILVSKHWHKLITSHAFTFRRAQFQTSSKYSVYVLQVLNRSFVFPISWTPNEPNSRLNFPWKETMHPCLPVPDFELKYGPADHVLFHAGYGIYCLFENIYPNVLLWNPTIKDVKVLPLSPNFQSFEVHVFHFGTVYYKDGNFSYKVGRVFSTYTGRDQRKFLYNLSLDIYSSETKRWKIIPNFASGHYMGYGEYISHCVNLNGRVHWVIHSHTEDTCVTTFDYETEVFGKIKAPSPLEPCHSNFKGKSFVTLFDDKFLCLVIFRSVDANSYYLDIWVMREYAVEDSWTKEFTVGPISRDKKVTGFSSRLRGVFLWRKNRDPAKLLFLDCKSSKMISCKLVGFAERFHDFALQVVEHAESILSVSALN